MKMYYSAVKNAFFDGALRSIYDASGSWPEDCEEVDASVFEEFSKTPPDGMKRVAAGGGRLPEWQAKALPLDSVFVELGNVKIDTLCDGVYTRFASRATRYEQKHREALDHQAGVVRTYYYLPAEATARGVSVDDMAAMVIAAADSFNGFGAAAEAARAGLLTLIAAAVTSEDKQLAIDTLVQQLETVAQGL